MTVLRPSPLPDELAAGYKGRVVRLNGWTDEKEAMQSLLTWCGNEGAAFREVSTVQFLAKVAGMEPARFVKHHTTLPLHRAVASRQLGAPRGSSEHGALLSMSATRKARPGAYFCVQCVEEDFVLDGTPYWRRQHQLPGFYCCTKHGVALRRVDCKDAFSASPTDFLDDHQMVSERWVATLNESAPVQRFLAISADLLARDQPLDERNVSKIAHARALALNLHVQGGSVRRQLISELIREQFDKAWLNSLWPGLVEKPKGQISQRIDGTVMDKRLGLPTIAYALAFSVLYDSAKHGINAMAVRFPDDRCDRPGRPISKQPTLVPGAARTLPRRWCHAAPGLQSVPS